MNLFEAQRVAEAASKADSGCGHCAWQVGEQLLRDFPEFEWAKLIADAGGWESVGNDD